MSCPRCYCEDCQRERSKWTAPPIPYSVPNTAPAYPIYPNSATPGFVRCAACGVYFTGGHICMTKGT